MIDEEEHKHILDGMNLEGMTFPTKGQESELWLAKVPNFCPKCEEIRGDTESGGNALFGSTQTFAYKSYGMCIECYIFQRDHPESAQKNTEAFQKRKEEKERQKLESFKAHMYRVYLFEPNEMMPHSPYAVSVTKVAFTKYPSVTPKGAANHTIPFLTKDEAERIVETLQSKQLTCWYEEMNHGVGP